MLSCHSWSFSCNDYDVVLYHYIDAPAGRKIKLLAVPFSKSIQFGPDDVHELASLLSESQYGDGGSHVSKLLLKNDKIIRDTNKTSSSSSSSSGRNTASDEEIGQITRNDNDMTSKENAPPSFAVRLPKLVSMFASRACRSAVMIGTGLSTGEMKNIVGNVGKLLITSS